MFFSGFFILGFLATLVTATVIIPVHLFGLRRNAQRWPRVMGRAHGHLVEESPKGQSTWSRDQWENAITMTSGDRYLYLLDRPDAASYSRARRHGAWWAVAGFAVIWVLIAALVLNAAFERRPIDRSDLIGTWAGHGSASQGAVVVERRQDGTYTAAGFRFPADLDHTGSWAVFNDAGNSSIDLDGRVVGASMNVVWYFFQPTISVCDGDPDGSSSCTTLVKTAPGG